MDENWAGDDEDLAALRPIADTEVLLALMPMSLLKALVGFLTFLVAFGLRREGAATWWFGFVLGGLTAGALIGVLLVGKVRRVLTEQQMLVGSLWLVAPVAALGALYPARWFVAVVAFAVGRPVPWPSPRSTPWSSAMSVSPTRERPSPASRPGSSSCGSSDRSSRWCSRSRWLPAAWSWPW